MKPTHFLFFLLFFLLSISAYAQNVPAAPNGYVLDNAQILGENISTLNTQLSQLEKDTSVEVAILTIASLEGGDMDEFTQRVFDTWKLGNAEKDNGLLIVIALQERKWRIQTGYGLEGTIPDVIASRIGRNILVPLFKEEKYVEGIQATVNELEKYIRSDPETVQKYSTDPDDPFSTPTELFGMGLGMFPFVLILFILVIAKTFIASTKKKMGIPFVFFHTLSLGMMALWVAIFGGFMSFFLLGTFYGLTLVSAVFLILLIFVPFPFIVDSSRKGFGGFYGGSGGFGRGGSGGFSGGGGFGGGMSGGGGAGGGW